MFDDLHAGFTKIVIRKEYYNIFIFDISDVSLQNVQRLNFSMAINFPSVLFLSFADFTIVVICLRMAK